MGAGAEAGLQVDLDNVIVIGRKDYVLRSVHPQASSVGAGQARVGAGQAVWAPGCPCPVCTASELLHDFAALQFGLQWNVTWGRLSRLAELEVQQLDQPGAGPAVSL